MNETSSTAAGLTGLVAFLLFVLAGIEFFGRPLIGLAAVAAGLALVAATAALICRSTR
jgi:hypothetical protein